MRMNKTDIVVTTIIITLTIICFVIGVLNELGVLPGAEHKGAVQQTTTYHLSIEKLTIKKVGD